MVVINEDTDVSSTADVNVNWTLTNNNSGAAPASDIPPTMKAGKAAVKTEKITVAVKPTAIQSQSPSQPLMLLPNANTM
jgi:hypothetical protein